MNFINKIKEVILSSSIKANLLKLYATIIIVMGSILVTLLLYSVDLNSNYNKIISNFKNYTNIYNDVNSIDKDIYLNITEQRSFNSKNYNDVIKNINNSLNRVNVNPQERDIYVSIEVLKRTVKTLDEYINETGLLIKNNSDYASRENKLNLIIQAKAVIQENIQQLIALDLTVSQKYIDNKKNIYNATLFIIIILFALSIFISIGFLLLVIRGIVTKISIISNSANKLANGHLSTEQISFSNTDEFHILAQSFNKMKYDINDYINKISSSEIKISTILNEMNDCVITTNSTGRIDSCNYAIEKIFRYERNEMLGKDINKLIPLIDMAAFSKSTFKAENLVKGIKIIDNKYQLMGLKKDGIEFPIELSCKEIELEGGKVITFVIHDVTQHKEIDKMKNEFISTVSHELRTPLTSIRGSLGLVLSEALGKLPEKSKDLLNIANNNSIRLINLINDILDLEKIKAGKMEFNFKELEVMPLVEESLKLNEEYAKLYNVKYELVERLDKSFINIDKDKFIQVVTNLLSNAAKFSFEGETVKISVTRKKSMVLVSVVNKGVGIPEQAYSKIFESFSQVDSSDSRKKGGTGLGLSITKSIIQKMGGQIGFTSIVNEDTDFYFELPEIIKNEKNQKVLICEDNRTTAFCIKSMFEKIGYNADIASSAKEATQFLEDSNYDLMTLDLFLPDKDGSSLLNELANNPKTKDLAIIIISVSKPDDKILKSYPQVIDWLEKSFNLTDLEISIDNIKRTKNAQKIEILHVENDEDILSLINLTLKDIANVTCLKTLSEAKAALEKSVFDIIILDYVFPEGTSDKLIPVIKSGANKDAKLIMFSSYEESKMLSRYFDAVFLKTNITNDQFKNSIENFISTKVNV